MTDDRNNPEGEDDLDRTDQYPDADVLILNLEAAIVCDVTVEDKIQRGHPCTCKFDDLSPNDLIDKATNPMTLVGGFLKKSATTLSEFKMKH